MTNFTKDTDYDVEVVNASMDFHTAYPTNFDSEADLYDFLKEVVDCLEDYQIHGQRAGSAFYEDDELPDQAAINMINAEELAEYDEKTQRYDLTEKGIFTYGKYKLGVLKFFDEHEGIHFEDCGNSLDDNAF